MAARTAAEPSWHSEDILTVHMEKLNKSQRSASNHPWFTVEKTEKVPLSTGDM